MTWKNYLYILLTIAIAGISALIGAIAGGAAVYRAVQQFTTLPETVQELLASHSITPGQTLALNTTSNAAMQVQVTLGEALQS